MRVEQKVRAAVMALATVAMAQVAVAGDAANMRNVAHVQVTEAVSAQQDWLTVTLGTTVRDEDAKAAQNKLNKAVRSALAVANKQASKGKLDVSSGNMNMYFQPKSRKMSSGNSGTWQGTAEVVLQGADFDRILGVAGVVQTMTVRNMQFGLSPATRKAASEKAEALAITAFGKQAKKVSQAFGFKGYEIREVNVNAHGGSAPVHARMQSYSADAVGGAVPGQAGQQQVQASVNGSIQMK